jgi:parallel beta-helix repeat protein
MTYRIPSNAQRVKLFAIAAALWLLTGCNLFQASVAPATPGGSAMPTAVVVTPTSAPQRAQRVDAELRKGTIVLHKSGGVVSLPALARALSSTALRQVAPGEWLLTANLQIEEGAELLIAGPEVRWLKLRSDAKSFVWIKAIGGTLRISNTKITSWDTRAEAVDSVPEDGRSFILARDGATMTIDHAEASYLGYDANESYGVAWRLEGTSGEASSSTFGYNFYGLYLYRAAGLKIRNNNVHHSIRYGIDPHTRSDNLLIEGNTSHHNGKQGIILAEGCSDSIIRNNTVYSNELHGIVLFDGSNNNLVEGNVVYDNALHGINVNASDGNTLRQNTVYDNGEAGIGVGQEARENLVQGNIVRANLRDGIYVFSEARETTLENNVVIGNPRYGIYIKSEDNIIGDGNEVTENGVGLFLNVSAPPDFSLSTNRIERNRETNVRTSRGGDDG